MLESQWTNERNLTMLVDYYELTMANGYLKHGMKDRVAVFDMFFRKNPDKGGFAIFAGLEQLIEYIKGLKFTDEDIAYFENKKIFSTEFLDYLRHFEFECDIWALPEGTPMFPGEPVVIVRGPAMQAQLVETMILLTINYQSMVATKANRIVRAAAGRSIFEFGSRRAQSYDAAILGARAAYIGGCDGTACVIADRDYKIPALGTMAHSWVQMFDSEYEAFKKYAETYPDGCTLLIDTYNVLKSGLPNAVRGFDEVVVPKGFRPQGVRIDSGDIAYLSKKIRKVLDAAGYSDVKIVASNSLDEYIIRDLILQGAKCDIFGVGENLITSKSDPVFGGVYKLVAISDGGEYIPKIKLSESVEKITTPHFKKLYRIYDKIGGSAIADYVTLYNEKVTGDSITIFDPVETWKKTRLTNVTFRELLVPVFQGGKCVYESPGLNEIRQYCADEVDKLWDEVKRFENPHRHYVDLSKNLWQIKTDLLSQYNGNV